MDNDRRPHRAVSVDMIGVEHGTKRFLQDGIANIPPVARWRNNLTVMSQHENLFFAASGGCVIVYQPEFPYQKLRKTPALIIQPELANPKALGYMPWYQHPAEGHWINHLVVGELGSQEIVLLATDCGNIEAYYTAAVQRAIDDIQRNGLATRFGGSVGLQPFFKHWVYQSAWGLDIHKNARMIAVSSNVPTRSQPLYNGELTATITVFAFALTKSPTETEDENDDEPEGRSDDAGDNDIDVDNDDDDDDGDDGEDEDQYSDDSGCDTEWFLWNTHRNAELPERTRNYKVVLKGEDGHVHNVPNICFVNSSEDSDGTWLLSTDITGIMKLWQIWRGKCIRQWDFSNEDNRIDTQTHASYPGWNVATLDVSTFRPVSTHTEFIGAERAPIHYGYHDPGPSFNLTSIARHIPGNSRLHPLHADFSDSDDDSEGDQIINGVDIDEEGRLEGTDSAAQVAQDTALAQPSPALRTDSNGGIDALEFQYADNPLQFGYEQQDDDSSEYNSDEDQSDEEDGEVSTEEASSTLQPPANRRISEIRSKVRPFQLPDMPIPEIAMIHCSNTHIRMLGSPKARYPHIFCANVLKQTLPEHNPNDPVVAELRAMNRLNMIRKIPELGVLLIATQTGRVAVCSLTRKNHLLGFRVDWVLPTKKQERAGQRPFCTLAGMAVAPIQTRNDAIFDVGHDSDENISFEDGIVDGVKTTFDPKVVMLRNSPTSKERHAQKAGNFAEPTLESKPWKPMPKGTATWQRAEGSRRYRIMLTYTDLTVLTYEISRNVEDSYEKN